MAFITLQSSNPNLSYIIFKNPNSGILAKEERAGYAFGYFDAKDQSKYHIYFRDSDTEVSFKSHPNEDFEFVNVSRYATAVWPITAISGFLNSAYKKKHEHDTEGFQNAVVINMMHVCKYSYVDLFQKAFPGFTIESEELAKSTYRLTIKTQRPIFDLLNFVNLFSVFMVVKNQDSEDRDGLEDFFVVDDNVATKYMNCLLAVDAPFFVRYYLKCSLLRSKRLFEQMRGKLEKSGHYNQLRMTYGTTDQARHDFVIKELGDSKEQIIDIGCGEGNYAIKLAEKVDGQYIAIDKDAEKLDRLTSRAERRNINNIITFHSLDDVLTADKQKPSNVILAEVLEHMEYEEAVSLLAAVFKEINFEKVIITLPNKKFNKYFCIPDDETRHPDHKFEPDRAMADSLIGEACLKSGRSATIQFHPVGDVVDGEPASLGFVIQRQG